MEGNKIEVGNPELDKTMAVHVGRITAYQEEIISMLAEIIARDKGLEHRHVNAEHIANAIKKMPYLVNELLNKYRQEVDRNLAQ